MRASGKVPLLIRSPSAYLHSRFLLHIIVSASTTLLTNILLNPTAEVALSDLRLIDPLMRLLEVLTEGMSDDVRRMYKFVGELEMKARRRVDAAARKGMGDNSHPTDMRNARSGDEIAVWKGTKALDVSAKGREQRETLEDFLKRIEYISSGSVEGSST